MTERRYNTTMFERYKRKELDYVDITALYGLVSSPSMRLASGRANEYYGRQHPAKLVEPLAPPDVTPVDLTAVVNEYNQKWEAGNGRLNHEE